MNLECTRIADQLRRAFNGEAWHGGALRELLDGVSAQKANSHPVASAHSIWEIVLHIDLWVRTAFQATEGVPMPRFAGIADWLTVEGSTGEAWITATDQMFDNSAKLAHAIEDFGDEKLETIVPGRDYNFYHLFRGIVQHSLYHAGQIALLKKAG